jgi:hypothetical protein
VLELFFNEGKSYLYDSKLVKDLINSLSSQVSPVSFTMLEKFGDYAKRHPTLYSRLITRDDPALELRDYIQGFPDQVRKKQAYVLDAGVDSRLRANRMNAFENFVMIQSDAALRQVAGQYAYDDNEADTEELTLRSGGEEINEQLEQKLNERLAMAGMEVVEARINYLAYAPEIAAVMLRRQQASAIITAREKIVEGAVSMVKMALHKLSEEEIVELDEDKKAAMVSNLLVVLCADEAAQPVVNTGTLNH